MERLYCAKCNTETEHKAIYDDPYFEFGLMCMVCKMVWEATLPDNPDFYHDFDDKDEDNE